MNYDPREVEEKLNQQFDEQHLAENFGSAGFFTYILGEHIVDSQPIAAIGALALGVGIAGCAVKTAKQVFFKN
jgi:hypothetical protein